MIQLLHQNPWVAFAGVLLWMLALLVSLRLYQLRRKPDPEIVRKTYHLAACLTALSFPWLFEDSLPVVLLAAIFVTAFACLRTLPSLKNGIGQVLHSVHRESFGEFAFLASIGVVFLLADGDKLLYSVPIIILAAADSAAALVGMQYGKHRYGAVEGEKSIEGSVAFFFAAFLCVHVPLLLWTDVGRLESLMAALNLGILVMLSEAVDWRGVDNLIIPVFSFILLQAFMDMSAGELAVHLAVLSSVAIFVRVRRSMTTLSDDALFGSALFGYVAWALGGWRWLIPPVLLFGSYLGLTRRTEFDVMHLLKLPVLLAVVSAALCWLLLHWSARTPELFYPYAASLAANLSIIAVVRHKHAEPGTKWNTLLTLNTGKGALLLVPSILAIDGFTKAAVLNFSIGLLAIFVAVAAFCRLQPNLESYPVDWKRWVRQSVVIAISSIICLIPHYRKIAQIW